MQRGNIKPEIILAEESIWDTPHVVQSIRRDEDLRWDEYLRILVQDLAFGMSQEKWVEQLAREGNLGLAYDLLNHLSLASKEKEIRKQEQDWLQMVEVAKSEADEYLRQQVDEITERDREEYEELMNLTNQYVAEKAFGDAVSTLEQALEVTKSSVERRRAAAAAAFSAAENKISHTRKLFVLLRKERFPGGSEAHQLAHRLLLQADNKLYERDYSSAIEISGWVEAICQGHEYPISIVEKLINVSVVPETGESNAEPKIIEE